MPPRLSIVIPAYNEEARITDTLIGIAGYLSRADYDYEVMVVDDGSTDSTSEICRKFVTGHPWFRLLREEANHGKGYAVRRGILESSGDYILMCDADLATPIEELDAFWDRVDDGYDIIIASRPIEGSHLVERQPFHREFGGRLFNLIIQLMAVPGVLDTQCGFKLFSRESAHRIFTLCTLDGFGFDIEVLHIAQRFGYRIIEVPIHWYHRPGSKVNMLRDGMTTLLDLFRIISRHRRLRGRNW